MKKHYPNWSKNWSGRGIAILNQLESYGEPHAESYCKQGTREDSIPFMRKLDALIKTYPLNNFYKSIRQQAQKGRLSLKQLRAVANDYSTLQMRQRQS